MAPLDEQCRLVAPRTSSIACCASLANDVRHTVTTMLWRKGLRNCGLRHRMSQRCVRGWAPTSRRPRRSPRFPAMPPLSSYQPIMYDAPPVSPIPFNRHADAPLAAEDRMRGDGGLADVGVSWFPADHLFTGASDGTRTRTLLAAVDGQARLVDDLLAACAAGAATLPPALLEALQRSAMTLATAQGNAQLHA